MTTATMNRTHLMVVPVDQDREAHQAVLLVPQRNGDLVVTVSDHRGHESCRISRTDALRVHRLTRAVADGVLVTDDVLGATAGRLAWEHWDGGLTVTLHTPADAGRRVITVHLPVDFAQDLYLAIADPTPTWSR
jgi:hypothetical protein